MKPKTSLKHRVIHGSAFVIAGHAVSQILRLGGNLVLTRLLFPEAFGLMTLVLVVVAGINMFSDMGIRGSIIYHKHGENPDFLNTAWTLQIIRGVFIWLVIVAITWPVSKFYEKPELLVLLPVVGFSAILDGLASTSRFTLIRRIYPARQVGLELGARVISLGVMILWATIWPSVWALVAGALVMALIKSIGSHMLIPGYVNQLKFDRDSLQSLIHYGRWVVLSTGLAFLLAQGDRAFLGKVLSSENLGIYSIAFIFAEALLQPVEILANSILQPLYARLKERGSAELYRKTFQTRALLLAAAIPGIWMLTIFGQTVIEFFYDERYWQAGWMIRILAIGMIGSVLNATSDRIILAAGDSAGYLILQILRSILLVIGMSVGFIEGDLLGLLIGLSSARLLGYIPLAFFLHRHGVWMPKLDLSVLGISAVVIASGTWIIGW